MFPGTFDELIRDDDDARNTFFGVRPEDARARTQAALDRIAQADSDGAQVVLLPELCLDAQGLDHVASWVETQAREIRIAVCGSAHREREGCRENVAFIAAPKETRTYRRVEQAKIVPFTLKRKEDGKKLDEDIRQAGRPIGLLSGRRSSLLVL